MRVRNWQLSTKNPYVGYQNAQNLICNPKNVVLLKIFDTPLFGLLFFSPWLPAPCTVVPGWPQFFEVPENWYQFFRNFFLEGLRYIFSSPVLIPMLVNGDKWGVRRLFLSTRAKWTLTTRTATQRRWRRWTRSWRRQFPAPRNVARRCTFQTFPPVFF